MPRIHRNRLDQIKGLALLKRGELTIQRIADRMEIPYNRLWQQLNRSGMRPAEAYSLAEELQKMGCLFQSASAELRILGYAHDKGLPLPSGPNSTTSGPAAEIELTPTTSTSPDEPE